MKAIVYEAARRKLCAAGRGERALALAIVTTAVNDGRRGCPLARQWFMTTDYIFWADVAGLDDALAPLLD